MVQLFAKGERVSLLAQNGNDARLIMIFVFHKILSPHQTRTTQSEIENRKERETGWHISVHAAAG